MMIRATILTPAVLLAVCWCQAGPAASAAKRGPVARWRFDAAHIRGNRVRPLVGSLSATIHGPVKFGEERPHGLILDGKKSYLALTEDLAQAHLPEKALSAEAWIRLDGLSQWGGIIGAIQDNGNFEKGWLLGTRENQFLFGLSTRGADDGDGRLTYLPSRCVFELGHWYQVVATYDGTTQKIYVDGRLKNSSTVQQGEILYPAQAFYNIGSYHDKDDLYRTAGQIAEVCVYDRALSAEEILARFEGRKSIFPDIEPGKPVLIDWPTYLRDSARTGITPERLKLPLRLRWTYQARHPPRPAWPPPAKQDFWHEKFQLRARVIYDRAFQVVSTGGRLYFGSSADDKLYCLDVQTGRELWSFFTEGPVRLAPTVDDESVYVGSDDGHVYCLDARSGKLRWKYRAGPCDRRVPGNGRMISTWPVRSGVMLIDGKLRFTAGLFPQQGTYQYSLDARTGKRLGSATTQISAQGYLARRGNQLYASAGRSPQQFVAELRRRGKGTGEYLGELPNMYPYCIIGAADVRFAGGDGQLAALAAEDGKLLWHAPAAGRAYSLAVASGCLFVSTDRGTIHCFSSRDAAAPARSDKHVQPDPQAANSPPIYPDDNLESVYRRAAQHILDETKIVRGYCLVVGSDEGRLAYEIARRSELQVIGIEEDAAKVAASRLWLDRAGIYGRVAIHQGKLDRLPYGDCLMNLVVSDRMLNGKLPGAINEILRVARPCGGAICLGQPDGAAENSKLDERLLRRWLSGSHWSDWKVSRHAGLWATFRRGPLQGAGQWTHIYAEPGNSACSGDQLLGGKMVLQWFGRPGPRKMIDRHHRTAAPLSQGGRLFVPGDNRLLAVDAYNGTQLWDVEVPGSRRVGALRDCGNMVATDDILYIVAGATCRGLAAETGEEVLRFRVPEDAGKKQHWGYVGNVGELLLGSTTVPGASRSGHSKATIQEGAYFDFRPIVTSRSIFCLDRHQGTRYWRYRPQSGVIVNPTITIGGGRLYLVESVDPTTRTVPSGRVTLEALLGGGSNLVALDIQTGEIIWRHRADFRAIQHHLYLSYAKGKLIAVGSRNQDTLKIDDEGRPIHLVWYDVHGIDALTGESLWFQTQNNQVRSGGDHGEQDHHPAIVRNTVYVEPYAYELATGRRIGWKLKRGGHGCGTLSASATCLFFRADNPAMCEIAAGRNTVTKITRVSRPGCWINIIPAGGLLLIPEASSGCTCDFPLQTSMALIPAAGL